MHLYVVRDSNGFESGGVSNCGDGDGGVEDVVHDGEHDGFDWDDVCEGRGVHLLKRFQG